MAKVTKLTRDRLLKALDYDPASGIFSWRIRPSNRIHAGDRAGVVAGNGHRYIMVDGDKFQASRLAWFYVHGEWPHGDVKFCNGNTDDCSIDNLRDVSRIEAARERGLLSINTSGYVGVSRAKHGRWQAKITWNYEQINLGASFETAEEASEMYEEAARRLKAGVATKEDRDRVVLELRTWRRQRTAWKHLNRTHDVHAWSSFDDFCATVPEFPETRYAMVPVDASLPIGPGNYTWTQPIDAMGGLTGAAYNQAVRDVKRDHERNKYLQRNYNITFAEELALRNEQLDVCAICESGFGDEAPSVDHDHDTQKVRGLLCKQCNYAIGQFKDNSRFLRKAAEYLERHNASTWSTPSIVEITHLPIGQRILTENAHA